MNRKIAIGAAVIVVVGIAAYFLFSGEASAGPYGGDLVPLDDGRAYAEVLANQESGELMAHVWDKDLSTAHPIPGDPITVGSGNNSVQLMPHPMPDDPPGMCSRFYGQADWIRGGGIHHGWLSAHGQGEHRQQFDWSRCWQGGRSHDAMWREMQGHQGMEHGGHGPHGGRGG